MIQKEAKDANAPGMVLSTVSAGSSQTDYTSRAEKQSAKPVIACEKDFQNSECFIPGIGLVSAEGVMDGSVVAMKQKNRPGSHGKGARQDIQHLNFSESSQNCTRAVKKRSHAQISRATAVKRKKAAKQRPGSLGLKVVDECLVLRSAGSGANVIEPAVQTIREAIGSILCSPNSVKEIATLILKMFAKNGEILVSTSTIQ